MALTEDDLLASVQAYYDAAGNKAEAARALGLRRSTFNDRLQVAQDRLGVTLGKVADGQIEAGGSKQLKLPKRGHVAYYLLTSIQNNTHLHPAFNNLRALVDWYDNRGNSSAQLMIGTYSYQMAAYGAKAVKRGTYSRRVHEGLWYAPEAKGFIVDESVQLAPGLIWCGEQNILPTAKYPLTGLEAYNGRESNIVPHAKIAMASVASMPDEPTKLNFTTGTMTQRNYIQKKAGILAEQSHDYGAAIACVDSDGNWFVRQLYVAEDDSIMDVGPEGCPGLRVQAGIVTEQPVVDNIYWGDIHVNEMDVWVRKAAWGDGGMLDALRPKVQYMGDIFSMRSRGHHEEKDFHATYAKLGQGQHLVQGELDECADFMNDSWRSWCETRVIASNHDRHLSRWLNEADFRKDPANAKTFFKLGYQVLDAMDREDLGFNVMEWALRDAGCPQDVRFLELDESSTQLGAENGLHGDLGPNGSRGSTLGLVRLGRPINKGHDHTAAIQLGVFSAGSCSLTFPYMHGPHSHSVSHIVTYSNGARAIVTMWGGKWRL